MPESVKYNKDEDLIFIDSIGKVTIEDWQKSHKRVMELALVEKCNNVLVDIREQQLSADLFDIHKFGSDLPRGFKFAVVTAISGSNIHDYLEKVGSTSGKLIKIFDSYDDALKWLNYNS